MIDKTGLWEQLVPGDWLHLNYGETRGYWYVTGVDKESGWVRLNATAFMGTDSKPFMFQELSGRANAVFVCNTPERWWYEYVSWWPLVHRFQLIGDHNKLVARLPKNREWNNGI